MNELFRDIENIDTFRQRPLAFRMRPKAIDEFIGQRHLVSPGQKLRRMMDSGRMFSLIFYGPSGCGKSALANVIAGTIDAKIEKINAVNSNVKEIREIIDRAKYLLNKSRRTILIIDEIHRFNRIQQDSLLPDVEEGNIVLIGITTENPFYFISGPLLSRASVFRFNPLTDEEIKMILHNAVKSEDRGVGYRKIEIVPESVEMIVRASGGDARHALNILELAAMTAGTGNGMIVIGPELIDKCIGERKFVYDRAGDMHYNTISAFIKSMRGSDPDAAVYYLARMITSGEDPRFIARRIAICASEDVGNADPQALLLANAALNAVEYIGMPEAMIILSQAAIYVSCAPKSNSSCLAVNKAMKFVEESGDPGIPEHLTKAGADSYIYPHDHKYGYVRQRYMNTDEIFYSPRSRGHEKYMKKYLDFIKRSDVIKNDKQH
ncbi:MAG: replication-associated recombination protein A [Elusimicrobia bacterium]|nr:replication-associated recombination protein A [Elusimicrobiota bacterium]